MHRPARSILSFVVFVMPALAVAAPPTVAQLGAELGLDANAIREVTEGKIVRSFGPESSERDLGAGFVFVIKAAPKELAQILRAGGDLPSDPNVVAWHRVTSAADFEPLRLSPRGADETKRYASAQAGDTLNVSNDEIAAFHKLGAAARQGDVEIQLRTLLFARYQAYRDGGLPAIAPYARGGGQERKPGEELRRVTELAAPLLQKYVPAFKTALEAYPKGRPSGIDEAFYWIVENLDDRPTVTLRHRMTLAVGDALVAADREYYVSQGYNAMQAVAGILPVEGGAMVFYRCHTSTDRIGGFGSASKHGIGRRVMAKQLEKIFERSRERVGR
jgi:hypothetical protein